MLGVPELLIILAIILIIFGAGKLPEIGEALGRGIRSFRKATSGQDAIDITPESERLQEPASAAKEVDVSTEATGSEAGEEKGSPS